MPARIIPLACYVVLPLAVAGWLAADTASLPSLPAGALAAALLALAGLASGFLAGLLGIGGALVTVPVLYLALPMLGVPRDGLAATVVATSLAAMLPTTVAAPSPSPAPACSTPAGCAGWRPA